MALVSVIVPVFNAEGYILQCLDSLQAQSFADIKIICIENGSTDNSWNNILSRKSDKRLLAMRAPEADVGHARNLGLFWALKTSPLVMFCDADDTYDRYMVEIMVDGIQSSKADFACCEIEVDYHADHELRQSDDGYYTLKSEGIIGNIKDIINNLDYSLCDKIFRASIIQKYSINFPVNLYYEDACFCWKYMSVANSAYFIKKRLYHYARHNNSIMNTTFSKSGRSIDHLAITDNVYDFLVKHNLLTKFFDEFSFFYHTSCLGFANYFADEDSKERIDILDKKLQEKFFCQQKEVGGGSVQKFSHFSHKPLTFQAVGNESAKNSGHYPIKHSHGFFACRMPTGSQPGKLKRAIFTFIALFFLNFSIFNHTGRLAFGAIRIFVHGKSECRKHAKSLFT